VVSFTPRPLHPQENSYWYPLDRTLGGSQGRYGRGGEEKNSQPLPGLEPPIIQSVVQLYTTELSRLGMTEGCVEITLSVFLVRRLYYLLCETFSYFSKENTYPKKNHTFGPGYANMNASLNTRVIESRTMRWAGLVALMREIKYICKISVGKPEGNRPRGRSRHRREDNIPIHLFPFFCRFLVSGDPTHLAVTCLVLLSKFSHLVFA
jgi:hypothetical protein